MKNGLSIEFLGIWEKINNPNFKGVEFDAFKNEAEVIVLYFLLRDKGYFLAMIYHRYV